MIRPFINGTNSRQNVELTALRWGETFSVHGCVGTKNKSCSSSQTFREQQILERPNNDDLTALNPRETSRVPDTVRREKKISPS